MIHSLRLKNFRAFEDTKSIELRKLNLFIGANNAGKTSVLSCIELLLRGMQRGGIEAPLAFSEMANFASFDSLLRKHWSPGEQRPTTFSIECEWIAKGESKLKCHYQCRGTRNDNTAYVSAATYSDEKNKIVLRPSGPPSRRRTKYTVTVDDRKPNKSEVFFHGHIPVLYREPKPYFGAHLELIGKYRGVEVLHPYRPVPRSFYVLDDPNLAPDDRSLLTYLVRIWSGNDKRTREIKRRITETISALGLAVKFDVAPVSRAMGSKIVEITVAPTVPRQRVTIADAGFGLSQVLPLAAFDARLTNGFFVAYQPEVHLHPRAQSRLADVLVNSIDRGNQVFVETHSPDLILRLQAKIARREISASDVGIFCFENTNGRSRISPVMFDNKGVPEFPWPIGFLDTSLNLARDLAAARQAGRKNAD